MLITNWLAKKDGAGGLALLSELEDGDVRIYGNIYGHPQFSDGEYVQTSHVTKYSETKVLTTEGIEYTLLQEAPQYLNFLKARENGAIIVKNWKVVNGNIVGNRLDSSVIEGRVVAQSFKRNICVLEDGRRLFVDWLSKDPNFEPDLRGEDLLVFCTEKCMPDVFSKHYSLFRRSCR